MKKILLLLSLIVMAMLVTGCAKQTTQGDADHTADVKIASTEGDNNVAESINEATDLDSNLADEGLDDLDNLGLDSW